MPKTTITHEPWCAEHIGDAEGLRETCCTATRSFETLAPTREGDVDEDRDRRGSLFVDIAEDEDEPAAFLEYHTEGSRNGFGRFDLTALRAVRAALVDDPKGFLYAIDKTLSTLDADLPL